MAAGRFSQRIAGVLVAMLMAIVATLPALPAMAAQDAVSAVEDLMDMVVSGDFSTIDGVVCEAQRGAVLDMFDPATALGVPAGSADGLDAFSLEVDDLTIEPLSETADQAVLRLAGSMQILVDESKARDLVRVLMGSEGEDVSEADIDVVLPLLLSAFESGQQLDEELTVIREGSEWLVCGGLGAQGPDSVVVDPVVSFDGICGLVPMADLNAITPTELQYDSSFGDEEHCSYSSSALDELHSLILNISVDDDLNSYRSFYPGGTDVVVAGLPAYVQDEQLFVGVDDNVLLANIFPGDVPPTGFDSDAYLTQVAELYVPLIPELELGADTATTTLPSEALGSTLCDAVSLEAVDTLSALRFDDVSGSADFCSYSSTIAENGYHVVSTSIAYLGLDELKEYYPDGEDLTVAGRPAYRDAEQLWVELEDAERSLLVGAYLEGSPGADTVDLARFASQIAELALPNVPGPGELGSGRIDASIDGSAGLVISADSLCATLDLEVLNALSVLEYGDVWDGGGDVCIYSPSDYDVGYHSLTVYREEFGVEEASTIYPGGSSFEIAGRPAYADDFILWVQADDGPIAIAAEFEGIAGAEDLDRIAHASDVAELLLAAIAATVEGEE